ncbi:MAG: hypothetical protein WB985_03670, partial [Candidatus Acidiferrales bacterium]
VVVLALAGLGAALACAAGFSSGAQGGTSPAAPPSAMHSIGVAFNYDFTKTPACTATVTTGCVAKFEVFDISVPGMERLLFTIAVPAGASGKTNLIKSSSPRMAFVIGKHRLGVSAVTPENSKSDPSSCSTIVAVGP